MSDFAPEKARLHSAGAPQNSPKRQLFWIVTPDALEHKVVGDAPHKTFELLFFYVVLPNNLRGLIFVLRVVLIPGG